jgi:hypothetical protein
MFKGKVFSFLRYNVFNFGDQKVSQFVVFEFKYLFSIIIFYFHKSEGEQDRFHTHAFNAISLKLFGQYTEYILEDEETGRFTKRIRDKIFMFFPRDSYHKIGNSTGCATVLFSGPWEKQWKEYIDGGNIVTYNWNREEIK